MSNFSEVYASKDYLERKTSMHEILFKNSSIKRLLMLFWYVADRENQLASILSSFGKSLLELNNFECFMIIVIRTASDNVDQMGRLKVVTGMR